MSFVGSSMHSRAAELVKLLDMGPHPEGGHYAEVFRSAHRVQVLDRNVERAALTAIYFLLTEGEFSRWHRVDSDEIWHYHEGDAIELLLFDDQGLRRVPLVRWSVRRVRRSSCQPEPGRRPGRWGVHVGRVYGGTRL